MAKYDELVGKQVGSYRIDSHLARGGMADVFIAYDVGLSRDVIIKVLLPSYIENEGFVERFRREAQAMARLEHPNIVQVYGTGATPDGRPYIAMQYVRGGTLEEKLSELAEQEQVMTSEYALAVARQVSSALQTAHEAGIVHRDLKPSNILLDEKGKPILTDLGIAYVADDARLTRTDVFLGTPHYMSPEQAHGEAPDARSDLYAMGVVLFEMLAGQRPFEGESHFALIHQHASEQPPPLKKIRPGLARSSYQIVDKALTKDPNNRYGSAAELVLALDKALADEGVVANLSSSGEWSWSAGTGTFFTSRANQIRPVTLSDLRRNRSRVPLILGALAVLLLAAGGLWFGWPTGGGGEATPTVESVVIIETQVVTSTPDPNARPTSTLANPSEEVIQVTQEPLAVEASPISVVEDASATATSQIAPTTATVSATPPRQVARALTNVFTRQGPGMGYAVGSALAQGAEVELVGRDVSRSWYQIRLPDDGLYWVGANFIEAPEELLSAVAVATDIPALPSATPSPTPTLVVPTSPPPGSGGGSNQGATAEPPSIPVTPPTATPFAPSVDPTATAFSPYP